MKTALFLFLLLAGCHRTQSEATDSRLFRWPIGGDVIHGEANP